MLRRLSDGLNTQENGAAEERHTITNQQEIQDQPVVRSTTVLIKQSPEKDQQGYEQEIKEHGLEPQETNAR